jgi:hypothetical protein
MITVSIPDNFISERKYIINVLLGEFLGLRYQIVIASKTKHYEMRLENDNVISIEDHFFSTKDENAGFLNSDNSPEVEFFDPSEFLKSEKMPVLYGKPEIELSADRIRCRLDIFAGCFFMLTRWEELVSDVRDEHGRFPCDESTAYKFNFLDTPVVNDYVELLWRLLDKLDISQLRKMHKYEFILTHDVDVPFLWPNSVFAMKMVAGDILKRGDFQLAYDNTKSFLSTRFMGNADPYDTFDYMMTLSEKYGHHSHFYFMSGGVGKYDDSYDITNPVLVQLLKQIDSRGHLIGFHPSYDTMLDERQWQEEYDLLSQVSPQEITEGRQHYLRFEMPASLGIWNKNLKVDSSIGYSGREGFRCGTCYEFSVFDVIKREHLDLVERPLIAMDATLIKSQGLKPSEVVSRIEKLVGITRKYNGKFVFLWHNSSFNMPPWNEYHAAYERILEVGK